jgi:hypothetical protein
MKNAEIEIIQLSDDLIIGKGRDRICYEHPTIKDQCIKISIDTHKQSLREIKYFSFLKNRNANLSNVSDFLGRIKTNLGEGFCFELIRDSSGEISPTVRQALEKKMITLEEIQLDLEHLKEYLIINSVCVRDISPSNISYQKTESGTKLVIIDGVSNSNFNPLTIRLKSLTTKAILKSWISLIRKLNRINQLLKD